VSFINRPTKSDENKKIKIPEFITLHFVTVVLCAIIKKKQMLQEVRINNIKWLALEEFGLLFN